MRSLTMPKLTFQSQGQIGDDYWHSILISVLRGLAAFVVAAAHLRAEMYPGLRTVTDPSLWFQGFAFVTGFAHQAVLVFFLISGWLVGGSLLSKIGQPGVLTNYAIDRASRLWTVLVPTFGLTLLLGLGTGVLVPGSIDFSGANEFSALSFAGNLFGLQGVVLTNFGGNYALWSLANETWYYVLFPLLVVLFTARRARSRLASGAMLALLATLLPLPILLYFSIWLLGVAFSRVRIECSTALRCAWLLPLAAACSYFRLTADNDRFDQVTLGMDILLSLMFLPLLSSLQFRAAPTSKLARPLARVGTFFANFSFSLYVLHLPLIFLLKHVAGTQFGLQQLSPAEPMHFLLYLGMLAVLLVGSYLSYLLFESQTYRMRHIIKAVVQRRPAARPAGAAAASAKR
ncbi:acyltransferase [Massilia sp. H6]|uniref:acyltransferase family protein n=1 Tax=Massilia sp. H6 TaxID=2970464 RepID=UPI0021693712|nr:acyltransferase family protein [Massilia sp. H6]UVW30299.1 acyltransferase family protein [Massilia sp. H6]